MISQQQVQALPAIGICWQKEDITTSESIYEHGAQNFNMDNGVMFQ